MNPSDSFGRRYGGYIGSKAGELLGGLAQTALTSLIPGITGLGAYTVRKNVFMDGRLPEVVNPSYGGQVVRFQEYLGDIRTSPTAGAFKIESYLLNAGNPETFPWLSQLAANYEQYEIEGMLFQFKSTSADALNSVNTALGTVMMATQYDVIDQPFTSKTEMLNYEFSTSCKPSDTCLHMIECDPRQTSVSNLYVLYNQDVPSNADPRLYNLGRFSIATTGFQGTSVNIGELHVTYQVKLLKPKLFTTLNETVPYFYAIYSGNGIYSDALPLGGAGGLATELIDSNFDIQIDTTNRRIIFPATSAKIAYNIQLFWNGSTGVANSKAPGTASANGNMPNTIWAPTDTNPTGDILFSTNFETNGNGLVPYVELAADGLLPTADQQLRIIVIGIPSSLV